MGSVDTDTDGKVPVSVLYGQEIRNTVILGLGFLFVFAAYISLQNLQGSLNDESGLGVISLSCLYAAAILSAIYAPTVITIIGVKRTVMLAYIGHLVYVSSNFYPSFYTLIPSSVILGAVTGPLWTSQGIYLTSCASSFADRTGMTLFTCLSRINGIFFTMYGLGCIIGNLLSSLVLYQGQYNITSTNISSFCGSDDCPQEETVDIIADPEDYIIYILLGIFLGCVVMGFLTVTLFLSPIENRHRENKGAIRKSLWSWFRFVIDTDIKFLIPLFFYVAVEQQIAWTEITKSFISCPIGIQHVGFVMTAFGVCSTLSTFAFSRIAKFTRRYVFLGFAATLQMSMMVWMYNWVPTSMQRIQIYVLASTWGVADGIWKTQLNAVLGEIFSENKHVAFAVYEGIKSIGFTSSLIYSSLLCLYIKLIIAMVILCIAMVLYAFVEVRFARKQQLMEVKQHAVAERAKLEI